MPATLSPQFWASAKRDVQEGVAAGERLETRIDLDEPLTAPVKAGTQVGQAVFLLDGAEVGRVDLLCGETVWPKLESAWKMLKLALTE